MSGFLGYAFIMPTMNLNTLICDAADSQLVVIDIQDRLANAMPAADRQRVVAKTRILLQAAEVLGVPQIVSEQYPKGLGRTDETLADCLSAQAATVEKTCFSCSANEEFTRTLGRNTRPQVILTGMESHVCVLQTAMALHAAGYTVFVVADAICARQEANHRNAVERMRQAGVVVTNTESVLFEWLRDARHEHFKALSALIK